MTRVTVYKNKAGDITGFHCEDHAGFANRGKDIVCAAISVLVINTINAVDKLTDDAFEDKQNDKKAVIDFRLKEGYSRDSQLLLQSMVLGLSNIKAENKKYISITFEEV